MASSLGNISDSLELLEVLLADCDMQVLMALTFTSMRINRSNKTQHLPVPGFQGLLFEHILFNSVCLQPPLELLGCN